MSALPSVSRLRTAGDSALLLELDAVIDADVNARAIGIAAAVRDEAIPGVRDVVSTYRSVAVHVDPLRTDLDAIARALTRASERPASTVSSVTKEIPVAYGGELGPDLDEVARFASLPAAAVIDRHASVVYRVFMLGFLPGFAYMGTVDPHIAAPRRPTPRVRVPAGSVGIAGRQTGIYPRESPGGWQIIGRTAVNIFDPSWHDPALFAPGDHVRFVPVRDLSERHRQIDHGANLFLSAEASAKAEGLPGEPSGGAPAAPAGAVGCQWLAPQARLEASSFRRSITVLRPGLLTTVQDGGRWGHQNRGVPVSGAMDIVSLRVANLAVGNPPDRAALEATLTGPELRMEDETILAIAGADLSATIDGSAVRSHQPLRCRAGSVLRFGERRAGARAYIAFGGGIDVPPVLGSRATHLVSGLGGFDGRPLRAGDRLPLGEPAGDAAARPSESTRPLPRGGARLRVLPGPQDDGFPTSVLERLLHMRFTISPQSDRMGYRLAGSTRIERRNEREMISDATFTGGIQVPSSGDPILLMADRPTTGGYPQIATVITADLPLAGQLAPGDWVEFERCSRSDALNALTAQEAKLLAVR